MAWGFFALGLTAGPASAADAGRARAAAATPADAEARSVRIVTSTPLGPNFGSGPDGEVEYRKGVASLMAGNPSRAAEALERSIAIRPDRPSAHVLLGVSLLAAGSPRAIGEFPLALRALLADFDSQARLAVNLILLVLSGVVLMIAGTLAASILRVLPRAAHEISEALPATFGGAARRADAVVLLAAPVLLLRPWLWPAGIAWVLLLLAILLRRSLGRLEKGLVITGALVIALFPTLLVLVGLLSAPAAPRSLAFAVSHARDPLFQGAAKSQIETALGQWKRDDPDLLLDLALIYRGEGRAAEAARVYQRILDLEATNAAARVNLGNILYARGDTHGALAAYREALAASPTSAPAHMNLGQALLEDFEITEAKAHMRTASSLNFDFVQSLSRASVGGRQVLLVDEAPTARDRWRWLLANRKHLLGITPGEAGDAVIDWFAPPTPIGAILLGLLLIGAAVAGKVLPAAAPCAGCGTPVCRRCRVRLSRRNFCEACAALAQDRGPSDRVEHEKEQRFRKAHSSARVVGLLLAILLPGAGHVFLERKKSRMALLFLAGIALFVLATGGGPLKPLPQLDREIFPAMQPRLLILLLTGHVLGIIHFVALARRRLA